LWKSQLLQVPHQYKCIHNLQVPRKRNLIKHDDFFLGSELPGVHLVNTNALAACESSKQNQVISSPIHHDHSNILNDHHALCIFIIFIIIIFQSKPRPDTPITPHAISGTWQSALLALSGWNCWVTWCTAIHLRVRFPGPATVANAAAH
jgi:hypothetical protein